MRAGVVSLAMDAYFEARLAFVDCPDARISTDDTIHREAIFVVVRERVDGEIVVLHYSILRSSPADRWRLRLLAERARGRWRHEMDKRKPSEPFDMARLADYVQRNSHQFFPLAVEVNQAWGAEMKMRLDKKVVLSPVAYRAVGHQAAPTS